MCCVEAVTWSGLSLNSGQGQRNYTVIITQIAALEFIILTIIQV